MRLGGPLASPQQLAALLQQPNSYEQLRNSQSKLRPLGSKQLLHILSNSALGSAEHHLRCAASAPEGLDFIQDDDTAARDINTIWSPISVSGIVTYIRPRAAQRTGDRHLCLHKVTGGDGVGSGGIRL